MKELTAPSRRLEKGQPDWVVPIIVACRAQVLPLVPDRFVWAVHNVPVKLNGRGTRQYGVFDGITVGGKPNLGEIRMNMRQCVGPETFKATLLHEFAHALVHWEFAGEDVGGHHGLRWQWWMKQLGQPVRR